jgi:hypothetical protein
MTGQPASGPSRRQVTHIEAARPSSNRHASAKDSAFMDNPTLANNTEAPSPATPEVKWNVDQLKSSYVNFANTHSTREEVVVNFGMNNNWDRREGEVEIELTHRIVMSPYAAKRLAELMTRLVSQYEVRYGVLK